MVYSVRDSFMGSFIIYVKIFTCAVGHLEELYQQNYIIKTPINDKSKEERIGSRPSLFFAENLSSFEYLFSQIKNPQN